MADEFLVMEGKTERLGLYYEANVPKESKAVIMVIHGMMEYFGRYRILFDKFVEYDFGYAAIDLPGHGKTAAEANSFGYWMENGFEKCADEINIFIENLIKTYRKPIILLGHSMGSFLSIGFVERFGKNLAGCILSGTNDKQSGLLIGAGRIFSSVIMKRKNPQYKSQFLHNMAFGSYNKKIKDNETDSDWLSTDSDEVEKYMNDPMCGFICSAELYKDLSGWLGIIYKKNELGKIPADLPIYIFSGSEDPVGNYGKGVVAFRNRLVDSGHENVVMKLYEGKRHECLNETNREEVMDDIIVFCNGIVPAD